MATEDLLGLAIPVTFLLLLATEALWPARRFPKVRGWRLVGVGFLVLVLGVGVAVPLVLPAKWLARVRLLDGTRLGTVGGTAVGYLALSLLAGLWHRAEHKVPFLWRWFHQMHHSPRRMDMAGAVYFHPFDMIASALLAQLVTVVLLGLTPVAAAATGFVAAFYGLFQHWNVRTPRWLGYLIQRPESHCLHHEKGVHARNYSDLPVWDLLFGGFVNPAGFSGEVGFDGDARVSAMLLGVDVSAPGAYLSSGATSCSDGGDEGVASA